MYPAYALLNEPYDSPVLNCMQFRTLQRLIVQEVTCPHHWRVWKIHTDQVPACYVKNCIPEIRTKLWQDFQVIFLSSRVENYFASSTPYIAALTTIPENRNFLKWLTQMWSEKLKVWLRLCSNLNHLVVVLLMILVKIGSFPCFIRVFKSFSRRVAVGADVDKV